MKTIAEHIREWRSRMNLTQDAAADKLGIAQSTYNDWENDKREVPFKKRLRVSEVIQIDLSNFFDNGDMPEIRTQSTDGVEKIGVKRFLEILEDNNRLLILQCQRLEAEKERLVAENNQLKSQLVQYAANNGASN